MTETRRRALEILKDHGPMMPAAFGAMLWPGSESWSKVGKCGAYGSSRGVGMRLASGAYLGKLQRAGLVAHDWEGPLRKFRLSSAGYRALESS